MGDVGGAENASIHRTSKLIRQTSNPRLIEKYQCLMQE